MTHPASPPTALQWAPDGQQADVRKVWNFSEPLALLLRRCSSHLGLCRAYTRSAMAEPQHQAPQQPRLPGMQPRPPGMHLHAAQHLLGAC